MGLKPDVGWRDSGQQKAAMSSPLGAFHAAEETVPGIEFASEAFEMFSVRIYT